MVDNNAEGMLFVDGVVSVGFLFSTVLNQKSEAASSQTVNIC